MHGFLLKAVPHSKGLGQLALRVHEKREWPFPWLSGLRESPQHFRRIWTDRDDLEARFFQRVTELTQFAQSSQAVSTGQ